MAGGIIQLVATGIPDLYLTGNPQITWFKILYRRYTEFSMVDYPIRINSDIQFGHTHLIKIDPIADKLNRLSLIVDVPTPILKKLDPIVETINSIVKPYDLSFSFPPDKKANDTVKYDDLFDDTDPNSLGNSMINKAADLETQYDADLDLLQYINEIYSVVSDHNSIGKYIAFRADKVLLPSFDSNIDIAGYILLTSDRTTELITKTKEGIYTMDLDESSFMYTINTTDITFGSGLINSLVPTSFPSAEKLVKIYPGIVERYRSISNISDLLAPDIDISRKRYHLIISTSYFKSKKKEISKNLYSDVEFSDETYINQSNNLYLDDYIGRELLFYNFDFNDMIINSDFEIGIYLFDIDDNLSDVKYYDAFKNIVSNIVLYVPYNAVDYDVITSNTISFNKFNININSFYDSSWDFNNDTHTDDVDATVKKGYWLLDASSLEIDPSNQSVSPSDNIYLEFKLSYVNANSEQLGFTAYEIHDECPSLVIKKTMDDTGIIKDTIVDNTIDGVTTSVQIYKDFYHIPSYGFVNDLIDRLALIGFSIQLSDIVNFHNFLLSIYNDTLNSSSLERNYKLENIKLYNSVDIRNTMYSKLIKDIIYVDQNKLSSQYYTVYNQFFRTIIYDTSNNDNLIVLSDTFTAASDPYIYAPSDTNESMVNNRNIVYKYTKFLLWAYYIENLYLKYDGTSNSELDANNIDENLKYISYMLMQIAKNPTTIDPNTSPDDLNIIPDDPTTRNIRFTIQDIDSIKKCIIYEDESIIEAYNRKNSVIYENGLPSQPLDSPILFAGTRYDNTGSDIDIVAIQCQNDNSKFGTCINREIEFYHVINSINVANVDVTSFITVYDYFINAIIISYDVDRNYLYTMSYETVDSYLKEYFNSTELSGNVSNLENIRNNLLQLIVRTVILTIINYIQTIFCVWQNSTYEDEDIIPAKTFYKTQNELLTKSYVEYNSNYVERYINDLPDNLQYNKEDPMLIRAKYYSGINIGCRPIMGYSYIYNINLIDPKTYEDAYYLLENTDDFVSNTNTIIFGSKFQDVYSAHIDAQIQKVKFDMDNLVRLNPVLNSSMSYVYWYDLYKFMAIIVDKINADLPSNIQYHNNIPIAILNHFPIMITYYYGQFMQHISNIMPDFQNLDFFEVSYNFEDIPFTHYPADDEDTINKEGYQNNPSPPFGSSLAFMGTDVRFDPSCIFHLKIKNMNNYEDYTKLYDNILFNGDISKMSPICPICFRTYAFLKLFDIVVYGTLLARSDNHIVDDAIINEISPNAKELNSIMQSGNLSEQLLDYTSFLYRPEHIIYDDITQQYFNTNIEFVIHRISTIYFRYKKIIDHICNLSANGFNTYMNAIKPTTISGNNMIEFNKFVNYLEDLRDINLYLFDIQIDIIISTISHTYNNAKFEQIKQIYESYVTVPSITYRSYKKAVSFIADFDALSVGLNTYALLQNKSYAKINNEDSYTILRYQMYRGNIIIWVSLQRFMISSYNTYFNNVLDPNVIDDNVDIHTEIYDLLKKNIDSIYINPDSSIDYYRARETNIPHSPSNNININTKILTYLRDIVIYYNILLARYKKLKFILDSKNVIVNTEDYYYNFSQKIMEVYLDNVKTTFNDMAVININQTNDINISEAHYYPDTSQYYFLNKNTFRDLSKNVENPLFTNDYQLFDKDNNYHVSQVFTTEQINKILRLLGMHDVQIYNAQIDEYYTELANGLNVVFNNNFNEYFTYDTKNKVINNYSLYLQASTIIYNPTTGFQYEKTIIRVTNNGLYNNIWYYCPTITNIIYDINYNSVILSSIKPNYDPYDPYTNMFDKEMIKLRDNADCNCMVTSPLLFIASKIDHSPISRFTHTYNLVNWENHIHSSSVDFEDNYDNGIEFGKITNLFVIYQFLMGQYNYLDFDTIMTTLEILLSSETNVVVTFLEQYTNLLDSIADTASQSLQIIDKQIRSEHMLLLLSIANVNTNLAINKIVKTYTNNYNITISRIDEIEKTLITTIDDPDTIEFIKYIVSSVKNILSTVSTYLYAVNISGDIQNVKNNINSIETKEDISYHLRTYLREVLLDQFFIYDIQISFYLSDLSFAVGYKILKIDIDNRLFTPAKLYNLRNLEMCNNFSFYKDAVLLILITLVSFLTSTLEFTSANYNISAIYGTFYKVSLIDTSSYIYDPLSLSLLNNKSVQQAYDSLLRYLHKITDTDLIPMSQLVDLSQYIDNDSPKVDKYYRYNLTAPQISSTALADQYDRDYRRYKQYMLDKRKKMNIMYHQIGSKNTKANYPKSIIDESNNIIAPLYYGSELYNKIMRALNSSIPQHAWVRFLGYRLIEEVALIIDGEQIDALDGDLMMMLYKSFGTLEHIRGMNIMLGNIPEMYTISNEARPSMRLYIQFYLFFGKGYGASLPLVNMLYSDIRIKLKLRNFDDVFYIEPNGKLEKPVKIKCHLLGNFIYLGDEERRSTATIKTENLIERYIYGGNVIKSKNDIIDTMTTKSGTIHNVIRARYFFNDPCKYLIWRITIEPPDPDSSDKVFWDLSDYRVRDSNNHINLTGKIINIIKKTSILFNNKEREGWRDNTFYQVLHPYNRLIAPLNSGEYFYSFCLFPGLLQPSGATNLSAIEDITFLMEVNEELVGLMNNIGLKIKIQMWECSYNIFVAISGFGALRFYSCSK